MKRKLIAFSMTMALLLSVFSAASVGAHTAPVEFTAATPAAVPSRAEWFGQQADLAGEAIIQRDSAQRGELIFNDASKDQRLITVPPAQATDKITREVDLDWFGVTADANNLYFIAKPDTYFGIKNDPAIELIITIDTNQTGGTQQIPLGVGNTYATTNVPADAAWEFAVDTAFRPGSSVGVQPPYVSGATTIWSDATTGAPCATCLSQLASASVPSGSFAEIAIPWDQIGGKPTGANFLRFTASIMYSPSTVGDVNSRAVPPTDGVNSPIVDFLGTEKTAADTAATLQSGTLKNTSVFDVHFDTNDGVAATYEPYSPLLVTEFQPNPLGTDNPGPTNGSTDSEWIEIYNPNTFAITDLSNYKVGNAAKRGSGQGMFKFVTGSIPAKGTIIVARFKQRFLAGHPTFLASNVFGLDVPAEMTPYTDWGTGTTIDLDNGPSGTATTFEEQVIILDGKDDIVDLVNYGNSLTPYPGNTPIHVASVPDNGGSYERCPAAFDTNDNAAEFIHHATVADETPGVACVGRPGIDMELAKTGPTNVRPGDPVQFTLSYANVGDTNEMAGASVTITDTLPTGLTFVAGNANPAPTTINGSTLTWVLPAPVQGGTLSTIVLTTTADAGLGPNVSLLNTAAIASPNEPALAKSNNVAHWTVTTLGPVDLSVSSNFAGPVAPGAQFSFTITYKNIGQDDATGVVVQDTLPAGITLIAQDADGASFNGGTSGAVSWNVGELPANASGVIVVTAQVASTVTVGTALANTITITGDNTEQVQANNTETKSLTVDFRRLYLALIRTT